MATTIKIKNSNVAGKVPGDADLAVAELGLNIADKKLYSKDGVGNVFQIGAAGEVPSGDTGNRPGSPSDGSLYFDTTLDLLLYWNGSEWVEVGAGGSEVLVQDAPPATTDLEEGTLWWNSDADDLRLYVLYNDPDPDAGLKWVQATPTSSDAGGVTSIIAGDGISVNQATGDVTVSVTDDGSGYVKLDDGGTKQVIQSAGLGLSDGANENITLDATDGSAEFASSLTKLTSAGSLFLETTSSQEGLYVGKKGSGDWNAVIDGSNGNASFAGDVVSGNAYNVGNGSALYPSGLIGVRNDTPAASVFQVLSGGSAVPTNETVKITAGGSADFAGSVSVGEVTGSTPFSQMVVGSVQARPADDDDDTFVGYTNSGAAPSFSVSGAGQANFGVGADWAGGFFNIRKPDNNWAQIISIDSTSDAPSGVLISAGVDTPAGGNALQIQKGQTNLGGSGTVDGLIVDWNGNAQFTGTVKAFAPSTSLFAACSAGPDGSTPVFAVRHSATAPTNGTDAFYVYSNGAYTTVSDQSQKKNIETTRDGYLEDLNKLRVVKYNWKSQDDGDAKELGLIAQEVQEVFPGLIASMGEDKDGKPVSGIKSSVLPFMLIKALQEANTKIEALEARLDAMTRMLGDLGADVSTMPSLEEGGET